MDQLLNRIPSFIPFHQGTQTFDPIYFLVGFIFLISVLFRFLRLAYKTFLRPENNLVQRYGEGTYAAITGASDGIGKAFCFSLAKRGFNIVLIARNLNKLRQVEKELKDKYPLVHTKIVLADFLGCTEEGFFEDIMKQLNNIDISILINNVGVGHNNFLTALSEEQIKELIVVNCIPQAVLSRHFIERFLKRSHKSCIISLSSNSALFPRPILQLYGATKIFNDFFSRSLALECPETDIISVRPSFVATNMTKEFHKKIIMVSPEDCVEAILRDIGYETLTYGHWQHKLASEVLKLTPEGIKDFVFGKLIIKMTEKSRKSRKNVK